MTNKEKENWKNEKTVATYYMGLVGLEIKQIIYGIEDHIIYVYTGDNTVHKSKIYYGLNPYFIFSGQRIRLDECIRTF